MQGAVIAHLADIGGLRRGISRARAAEWCWAHTSPTFYRMLVLQQQWPKATFQQWLAHSISATVLPPG